MSPEMGQGFFRIGMFMVLLSALLLPFLSSDSPEFVVDVLALIIGLVFIGVVAYFARRSTRG
jgi:hypothetical protein